MLPTTSEGAGRQSLTLRADDKGCSLHRMESDRKAPQSPVCQVEPRTQVGMVTEGGRRPLVRIQQRGAPGKAAGHLPEVRLREERASAADLAGFLRAVSPDCVLRSGFVPCGLAEFVC